jgi:hypothetical protein
MPDEPTTPNAGNGDQNAGSTPPAGQAATPPAGQGNQDPPKPPAETDWKSEAQKWEKRAKDNADAAKRLADIEEANKTEEQRRSEALAAAQKTAQDNAAEAARLRLAIKHGLSDEDLDLLGTGSDDELETRAKRIVALRGTQGTRRPITAVGNGEREGNSGTGDFIRDALRR